MKHLNIRIFGKVQGVFYRATSKIVADQLGVKGFVKNEPDGSVYMEAEADDFEMELFLEFCNKGSDKAIVDKIETSEAPVKNYRNFEVVKKNLS
ncbi:acylphosphatase [Daejeonella oryzae]|uniref:acylphosphatase n=1 Tax=Daejeonella oryzae TaxID=1122943 RepID=UPI00041FA936|nr:acylphosphatase [Daejeonella oryzae]